ncbi:MAG: hypothetical protein U0T73_10200 [Chitinophagales bacterium]
MKTIHSLFTLALAVIFFASCSQSSEKEKPLQAQRLFGENDSTNFEREVDTSEVMCYDVMSLGNKIYLVGIDHSQTTTDQAAAFALNYTSCEDRFYFHNGKTTWSSPDSILQKNLIVHYESIGFGNLSLVKGDICNKEIPLCPLSCVVSMTQAEGSTIVGYIDQNDLTK